MDIKKDVKPTTYRKPRVKSAALDRQAVAPAAPAATTTGGSTTGKIAGWLGLGAAGTAATQAAVSHHRAAGYHVGPRGWHDNFPPAWGDKGWVEGTNEHGNWVFAGHRPAWWQEHYATYWKDVVGPLYRKSAEHQKTLGK